MTSIDLTTALKEQIDRVLRAMALYPNADEGRAPLELEQVALAARVIDAYQSRAEKLPTKARTVAKATIATPAARRRRA